MFCRDCGAQMQEGAKFCEACGAQVSAGAQVDRPEGRRSSRRWLAALVLVFLLGAAAAWIYVVRQRSPKLGDVWVSPKDGAEMVYVPAGEFLMGSTDTDRDARTNERPQFRASLPGYWIDKCEVTVAQYRRFCQETGREMPPAPSRSWRDDHPVATVTWRDAAAYAEWAGKRLPTEMEWEKAARGTDGREYPWGNSWDEGKCVNEKNSSDGTRPVGNYPAEASPCGALDMAGNVLEWCADWFDHEAYQRYARGDFKSPASGNARVLRGGFWTSDDPAFFRCACRQFSSPDDRGPIIGFRCVRGPL